MTWLAWRQFRAQAALAAALTAVVAAVLVATRHHIATVDEEDLSTFYKSLQLLGTGLVGVPAFIGAFWGAPLLAREIEAGTHRLVWTQSITRRRWLAVKLAVIAAVTVVLTAAFSLLFTWWSLPFDETGNRIGTANFGQRGIAPVAYALFALALGTLLGAVIRRPLPAMAGTLAGFLVVRFSFQLFVRPNILHTVTANRPSVMFGSVEGSASTAGAWITSGRTVDAAGNPVSGGSIDNMLAEACNLTRDSSDGAWDACAHHLGIHDVVTMHPASQFWTLQAWETAGFLALAATLAAATFWWIRHRTS
ncbi:MAG TPA: ABC transporter permease subunit [Acidimicrobiales bacterium]|nr:ABC transporter permease subunit [Acidimicrobiales bacterium]